MLYTLYASICCCENMTRYFLMKYLTFAGRRNQFFFHKITHYPMSKILHILSQIIKARIIILTFYLKAKNIVSIE